MRDVSKTETKGGIAMRDVSKTETKRSGCFENRNKTEEVKNFFFKKWRGEKLGSYELVSELMSAMYLLAPPFVLFCAIMWLSKYDAAIASILLLGTFAGIMALVTGIVLHKICMADWKKSLEEKEWY